MFLNDLARALTWIQPKLCQGDLNQAAHKRRCAIWQFYIYIYIIARKTENIVEINHADRLLFEKIKLYNKM